MATTAVASTPIAKASLTHAGHAAASATRQPRSARPALSRDLVQLPLAASRAYACSGPAARSVKGSRRAAVGVRAGLLDSILQALPLPLGNRGSDVVEKRAEVKAKLLEAIVPVKRGLTATEEDIANIEALASELEDLNPTKAPLKSPLINGKWKLLYTTSESILGKNKPFFLQPQGPIFQAIDTETLQARNIETWPLFNQVQATLTPTSGSNVDVKFDEFKILSLLPIKAPDSARGTLDTTYLDDDLRISRGNRGNLFVLTMEDPSYKIPFM